MTLRGALRTLRGWLLGPTTKERFAAAVARETSPRARKVPDLRPIYDDIFAAGALQIDALAGPSVAALRAGEVVAANFAAGVVAPPLPPLTEEEAEAARRVPPPPVPDWCSRSPLAEKARRRRHRRWLARVAWCGPT